VRRALARNPVARYQSIDEFAAALEAFQARARSLVTNATRTSDPNPLLGPGDATLAETGAGATLDRSRTLTATPTSRRLRSRFMFAGGLLTGALLGAGATISATSPRASESGDLSTRAAPQSLEGATPAAPAEPPVLPDPAPHPPVLEPSNQSQPVSHGSQPPDVSRRPIDMPVSVTGARRPEPMARPSPPASPMRAEQADSTANASERANTEASLDLVPNLPALSGARPSPARAATA